MSKNFKKWVNSWLYLANLKNRLSSTRTLENELWIYTATKIEKSVCEEMDKRRKSKKINEILVKNNNEIFKNIKTFF